MRALHNHVFERPVTVGSTLTLSKAAQGGIFKFNLAAGSTVTLPASNGDGATYAFIVAGISTGTYVVKVANTNDIIQGFVQYSRNDATGTSVGFAANATSDTITLNAGTSGGVIKGEHFEIVDLESGVFVVTSARLTSTGAAATPFSASV